jgi:foldase protein PrsA
MEEIENKAKEVLKSIRDGADFDELMNKYGEDPGAKEMPEGYTFGKGEMVKEFEESAFSMKAGEVSDLVKTVYGYHIIKVVEKIPEKQLLLDEVKKDIKPDLDQKAKSDYLENLLAKWKNISKIKNNVK